MPGPEQQNNALEGLINDLLVFIELSFQDDETSLREWISETINKLESRCWERTRCGKTECPAYESDCGRCWLIAGTMCGGKVQGKFVQKYGSCTRCEVYREVIGSDPVRRLRELTIVLIHSLRLKQEELKTSLSEIRQLTGLLPICASCKKIRDDQGYWSQIETYIRAHTGVEFSHGICPDCLRKLYPGLADNNG